MEPDVLKTSLMSHEWSFGWTGQPPATTGLRFYTDGRIGRYDHPNERRYRLDGKVLHLIGAHGEITSTLDRIGTEDGRQALFGFSRVRPGPEIRILRGRAMMPLPPLQTRDALRQDIERRGWSVGEHTYGQPSFVDSTLGHLTIGRFCSIAGGVKIVFGNHRTDTVSTFPFASFPGAWPTYPEGVADHVSRGPVVIGNDVWIGDGALILSGVTIGDGAVIGARAVVSRDVPPYAVASGIPARVLRHRFSEDRIAALLDIRWWDWPKDRIDACLPLMMSGDIDAFIAQARAS